MFVALQKKRYFFVAETWGWVLGNIVNIRICFWVTWSVKVWNAHDTHTHTYISWRENVSRIYARTTYGPT